MLWEDAFDGIWITSQHKSNAYFSILNFTSLQQFLAMLSFCSSVILYSDFYLYFSGCSFWFSIGLLLKEILVILSPQGLSLSLSLSEGFSSGCRYPLHHHRAVDLSVAPPSLSWAAYPMSDIPYMAMSQAINLNICWAIYMALLQTKLALGLSLS